MFGLLIGCDAGDPPASGEIAANDSDTAAADSLELPAGDSGPPARGLVDPALTPAIFSEGGWMYGQVADADLDADGVMERVVLTARVEMIRGRPAWDDGQPWQVYVEEPEGDRTYLYARYVQLGTVTMRIGLEEPERPATVVLLEHVPDRVAFYEIVYEGPGITREVTRFERMVDPTGELASPDLP